MPRRVEEDPHVVLRLVFGQFRTQAQRMGHGAFEVGDPRSSE